LVYGYGLCVVAVVPIWPTAALGSLPTLLEELTHTDRVVGVRYSYTEIENQIMRTEN